MLVDKDKRLVVSRILGYEKIAHGIDRWKSTSGEDAVCWICERFKFTMFLLNKPVLEVAQMEQKQHLVQPLINTSQFKKEAALSRSDTGMAEGDSLGLSAGIGLALGKALRREVKAANEKTKQQPKKEDPSHPYIYCESTGW